MKREIKFRGKRLRENCEWITGYLAEYPYGTFIEKYDREEDYMVGYEVDPSTVGQYTGLKDRNGREIYEGDIVKVNIHNTRTEGIGVVEWNNETCVFGLRIGCFLGSKSIAGTWRTIEVIGNIHDNPEMLNK